MQIVWKLVRSVFLRRLVLAGIICAVAFVSGALRAEAKCFAIPGAGSLLSCEDGGCCNLSCLSICITIECSGGVGCGPNGGNTCYPLGCRMLAGNCGSTC